MAKLRPGKIRVAPLAACEQAERFVLGAGFTLVHKSNFSEARYYTFPGRYGVLRIATHRKGKKNEAMPNGPTWASITFHEGRASPDGFIRMTGQEVEFSTATAIGIFIMRASVLGKGEG